MQKILIYPKSADLRINTHYNRIEAALPNLDIGPEIVKMSKAAKKGLVITIEPYRGKKQSATSRQIMTLCAKIADAMSRNTPCKKEQVYRKVIEHSGIYQELWIKNTELEERKRMWSQTHEGNFTVELNSHPDGGSTFVKQYYGISTYSDEAKDKIYETLRAWAKQYGIKYQTPAERALIDGN